MLADVYISHRKNIAKRIDSISYLLKKQLSQGERAELNSELMVHEWEFRALEELIIRKRAKRIKRAARSAAA